MKNFLGWGKASQFAPHVFQNQVCFTSGTPHILVTPEAYKDMYALVNLVDTEVGWVGTVARVGNDFLIKEVFLLDQEVHATTTEISPEGLADFATKILAERPDGMDVVNAIRFWGHSHVRMGTSPSGQDDDQIKIFSSSCEDFFIRGILNKLGRIEFTLYLFSIGVEIHDAEWAIYSPEEDSERNARWEREIASKVREKKIPIFSGTDFGFGKKNHTKNSLSEENNFGMPKGEREVIL